MRVGGFEFTPGGLPSLVTLLLLCLTLGMGVWQWDRARQKEVLLRDFADAAARPPAELTRLDPADPRNRFRRVWVRGRYDGEHSILLDNQVVDGRPGWHVFTPLWVPALEAAVLVNRGWVAAGPARRLPQVTLPVAQPVTVRGRLGRPANPGLRLGQAGPGAWPRVVPFVDYDQLAGALGYPLVPAVLLLDPDQAHGWRRDWRPRFAGLTPARHRGYTFQWFALSLALVVIYIVVNTRRAGGRA